ncbi:hypothetical protein F8388_001697 [Cannabis sativa]|uniref:Zinc knuckle CX2CX4HX4C domain-containing protein n=1 Tax=Cannabis sativa TaxID=3483 RepID=A0A7J6HLB2_CANSA|nr:hypothetical protein F8388_001697 [Cannabis sativa]
MCLIRLPQIITANRVASTRGLGPSHFRDDCLALKAKLKREKNCGKNGEADITDGYESAERLDLISGDSAVPFFFFKFVFCLHLMVAVVLRRPREVVIIAPIDIGLLKGFAEHLCKSSICRPCISRYWFLLRSSLFLFHAIYFFLGPSFPCCSLCLEMDSLALNVSEILNLTDKEAVVHDLEEESGGVNLNNKPICLVFRVLSPRTIKPEWFEDAMRNAWVTRAFLTFSDYGSGMFMVEFQCEGDMRRLRYSPFWIQVHSIPFGQKSLKLAKLIGDEVGDFLEVDKITLLKVSGLFLRIRVLIDVSKPITRAILVDFKSIHREKWLNFKYENLPNICYHCGMFDHTLTKCITYLKKCDDHALPPPLPYKIPLKAPAKSTFKRNPFDLSNSFPIDEAIPNQEKRGPIPCCCREPIPHY